MGPSNAVENDDPQRHLVAVIAKWKACKHCPCLNTNMGTDFTGLQRRDDDDRKKYHQN